LCLFHFSPWLLLLSSKAAAMLGLSAFVPRDPFHQFTITLCIVGLFLAAVFVLALKPKSKGQAPSTLEAYLKFIYTCFLKPHAKSENQQDALVRHSTFRTLALIDQRTRRASTKPRPTFTMPLASSSFGAAKTCWDWSQHSSNTVPKPV
jgi:hypothetical protein